MADRFEKLTDKHIEFINKQYLFFVGSAGAEGSVNVSPKGMDTLKIINNKEVVWLNLTGSGNETAAHVMENGRMTLMFCSFEKHPLILRLYGKAKVVHPRDDSWEKLSGLFAEYLGVRQCFVLSLDLVQTSCGFGVPFFEYLGERETLKHWANKKGQEGVEQYWKEKNQLSLDGKPTYILENA